MTFVREALRDAVIGQKKVWAAVGGRMGLMWRILPSLSLQRDSVGPIARMPGTAGNWGKLIAPSSDV